MMLLLWLLAQSAAPQPVPAQGPPVSSPFMGSVPASPAATAEPLPLSIKDAVRRALQHNLGLLLAEENAVTAHGARWRALAELLPNVSGSLGWRRQVLNLEAFGFPAKPPIVGPFNVEDYRVYLSQPVVDLAAMNDARAASANERAERYGIKDARDLVTLVAVNLYLEAVAQQARIDSARAQRETADALYKQATDLKGSGLVAGIDVLRAQVQLQAQRQRVIVAENEFEKTKLQLARAIGLPVGQPLALTDKIPYAPLPPVTLDQALLRALESRPDYLALKERVAAAEAAERAANAALLPSLHFDADYGAIGNTASKDYATYTIAGTIRVPVFDAGRTRARRIEAQSLLKQRQAEFADFRGRVEYDVRAALLDVRAAEEELQTAQTGLQLANDTLQQARDRFAAGVASNLEVTQAQESVAAASDAYINALYGHNLAKATLARAIGIAEQMITGYLGGLQ
jgi:outer membrane protein TolC